MYRYQGNTGRYVWVPDGPGPGQSPQRQEPPPRTRQAGRGANRPRQEPPAPEPAASPLRDLGGSLSGLLSNVFPDGFEMEDALLLLVLFLMYKETGDKEYLIVMGAMFLL